MKSAARITASLAALAIAALGLSCQKSDPTAPGDGMIEVTANPTDVDFSVDPDGTSTISATVIDKDGREVAGAGVHFSTTAGTLQSNGGSVRTNGDGVAKDVLRLMQESGDATVTARSGKLSGTATVSNEGEPSVPTVMFVANPTCVMTGVTVSFTDQSTHKPTKWDWDFGDGQTASCMQPDTTCKNPTHPYTTARSYSVTLTASNSVGDGTPLTKNNYITVVAGAPVADFTFTPNPGTHGSPITFTDTSTNSPTTWDWDFGDSSTHSSIQNPMHTYVTAGTFSVKLTATNCESNTKTQSVTVN